MPRKRSSEDTSPDTSRLKKKKTSESTLQAPTERSPSYHALDDEEKADLCRWLNERDQDPDVDSIFTIKTTSVSKKTKAAEVKQLHLNGRDHLTVAYTISPEWRLLRKYKKFTLLNQETLSLGSCVFIEHGDSGPGAIDFKNQWKAQVLEIRALDCDHVYLLVAYLQNPHELPGGASKHHAPNELVPSNELAIIDALTVNGGFEIVHWNDWNEENDETPPPCPDSFFWRQTYNIHSRMFSPLRKICACNSPRNPSHAILQCKNCAAWLHQACIVENARGQTVASNSKPAKSRGKKGRRKSASSAEKEDEEENEEVNVVLPNGDEKPKLVFHGAAGDVREEGICCLLCSKIVD